MSLAIHVETVVLPGNRISIQTPELPEGRKARVFVFLEDVEPPKRPIYEVLGDYKGGQSFKTAEEVDEYIRQERDSWDR